MSAKAVSQPTVPEFISFVSLLKSEAGASAPPTGLDASRNSRQEEPRLFLVSDRRDEADFGEVTDAELEAALSVLSQCDNGSRSEIRDLLR